MPALTAIITGNARGLNAELNKSLLTAETWSKQMKRATAGDSSTYASVLTQGDVKKALDGVGGAAGGAHIPVRGLSKLLAHLGVTGAWSTSILINAFKNPIFLAIGIAAGALWLFNKALNALGPIADTLGTKSLAPQMEHFKQKVMDSKAAMLEWADSLKHGRSEADKLGDSLKELENRTTAQASADERVAEAKKEVALAQIKQLEAQGKITKEQEKAQSNAVESQYDKDKLKRANDARNVIGLSLWDAADKSDALAKEAKAKVPGLSDASLTATGLADANAERIKNAEENLKQLKKKRQELGAGGFAGMGGNAATRLNQDILDSARTEQPGLMSSAKLAGESLKKAEKESVSLREDADAKRRDADMKMTKGAAEYMADKEVARLKEQKRMIEGESGSEKMKLIHGSLTANQRHGAYASPASSVMVDTAKRSERHLAELVNLAKSRVHGSGNLSGHKY